jgi:hypothetical protein
MERAYVSGKITGLKLAEAKRLFGQAEKLLIKLGYEVFNPFNLQLQDDLEWIEYMEYDIDELKNCDVIALLPNWYDSRGARIEKRVAEALKLKIMFFDHNLRLISEIPAPIINSSKDVLSLVATITGCSEKILLSRSRKRILVDIRHCAFMLARHYTNESLERIAITFKRDHTSIIHGIKSVAEIREKKMLYEKINNEICKHLA